MARKLLHAFEMRRTTLRVLASLSGDYFVKNVAYSTRSLEKHLEDHYFRGTP